MTPSVGRWAAVSRGIRLRLPVGDGIERECLRVLRTRRDGNLPGLVVGGLVWSLTGDRVVLAEVLGVGRCPRCDCYYKFKFKTFVSIKVFGIVSSC